MQNSPGTNYFVPLDKNVSIALTSEDFSNSHLAVLAACDGNPNAVAVQIDTYANGCIMLRTDLGTGNNIYTMTGAIDSPVWTLLGSGGSGSPGGVQYDVQLNDGSGGFAGSNNLNFQGGYLTINGDSGYGQLQWLNSPATGGFGGSGINGTNNQIISGALAGDLSIWSSQGISISADTGSTNMLGIDISGALLFGEYGVGSFTGTPVYSLQVDSSGNVIEGAVAMGTIGGSINTNEIAFGVSIDTIGGSSNLIYGETAKVFQVAFDAMGNRYIFVNAMSHLFQFGDIDIAGNGSSVSIDDSAQTITLNALNGIIIPDLAPATTQMVTVDSSGLLGHQTIPTGSIGGSIASNQIAFGVSTNSIGGTDNFSYDPGSGIFYIRDPLTSDNILTINPSLQLYIFGNNFTGNDLYIDESNQFTVLNVAGFELLEFDPISSQKYYFGDFSGSINNSNIQIHDSTTALGTWRLNNVDSLFMDNSSGDYYFGDAFGVVDGTHLHLNLGGGTAEIVGNTSFKYISNSHPFLVVDPSTSNYSLGDIDNSVDGNSLTFSNPSGNGGFSIALNGNNIIASLMTGGNPIIEIGAPFFGNHTHLEIDDSVQTISTVANDFFQHVDHSGNKYLVSSPSTGQYFFGTSAGNIQAILQNNSNVAVGNTPAFGTDIFGLFSSTSIEGAVFRADFANGLLYIGDVDNALGTGSQLSWNMAGATLSFINAQIDMGLSKIVNLGTPTNPSDAANKSYIDAQNPIVANNNLLNQSTAVASIATYTPSANATLRIGGYVTITAVTLDVIQLQVTYTDETTTVRTQLFFPQGLTSANLASTGAFTFPTMDIRVLSGAPITVKTVLTTGTGSIAYDVGASITKIS